MDATYRADLQSLNELNFARFDAKLEQRVVELNARIDRLGAELNARIDKVAAELKAELIKWMFVFWAGSALAAWLAR